MRAKSPRNEFAAVYLEVAESFEKEYYGHAVNT
jgi:hypothetical protein